LRLTTIIRNLCFAIMSLWIRSANIFPRFVDECLSDFRHMETRMRQMERMMLDPPYRMVPSDVLDKSVSGIVDNESKFAVSIDVSKFKPEHLKVNIDGRCLTIEGKEELEEENGYSMRSVATSGVNVAFTRQFVLPEDVNLEAIRSSLTDDGKLSVEAPKLTEPLGSAGRSIPIEHVTEKT
uniref:Putative Heat Shock Protein n=1 Tax=Angiostrongylus cantonensis TaxID=6313 RepID=A0A0K0CYZ3_ANGCA